MSVLCCCLSKTLRVRFKSDPGLVMIRIWSHVNFITHQKRQWHSHPQYSSSWQAPFISCTLVYLYMMASPPWGQHVHSIKRDISCVTIIVGVTTGISHNSMTVFLLTNQCEVQKTSVRDMQYLLLGTRDSFLASSHATIH